MKLLNADSHISYQKRWLFLDTNESPSFDLSSTKWMRSDIDWLI